MCICMNLSAKRPSHHISPQELQHYADADADADSNTDTVADADADADAPFVAVSDRLASDWGRSTSMPSTISTLPAYAN